MIPTILQHLTPPVAEEFLQTLADGVPPHNELTRWLTVGQEGILSEFHSNLETVAGGGFETLLLLGDPGAGKSHILATLEQLAFDNQFATSFFSQDPQSRIGFNRPAQLYKKLVESLRLPERRTENADPLRLVLDKWADRAAPVLVSTNPSMAMAYKLSELGLIPPAKGISARTRLSLLGYLLATQNSNQEAQITFLNVMRGPGVTNSVLMQTIGSLDFFYPYGVGYTPSDYDEKYYFGQLRTLIFILRVLGYRGLVALFDEVTAIVGLYSRSREKAYRVLNSLFFNEWEYEGFYTVFAYLPAFINQLRADRYLSGGDLMEKWSPIWEKSMRQVASLNSHQMFELAKRLAMIHSISWEWDAWPSVANVARTWIRDCEWQGFSLRDFVRGLIQRFDQYRDEQ
jgi:hypothetical protein